MANSDADYRTGPELLVDFAEAFERVTQALEFVNPVADYMCPDGVPLDRVTTYNRLVEDLVNAHRRLNLLTSRIEKMLPKE